MDDPKNKFNLTILSIVAIVGIVAIFFGFMQTNKSNITSNIGPDFLPEDDLVGMAGGGRPPPKCFQTLWDATFEVSKTSLFTNEEYTIGWSIPEIYTINSDDWIALVPKGNPSWPGNLPWFWTNRERSGTSDGKKVTNTQDGRLRAPAKEGTYEVRYFTGGNFVQHSGRGPTVTVVAGPSTPSSQSTQTNQSAQAPTSSTQSFSIIALKSTLAPGEEFTVTWSNPGTTYSQDWIAMVQPDKSFQSMEVHPWFYTDGLKKGSKTLKAPSAPGTYELRYYENNGFNIKARGAVVTITS